MDGPIATYTASRSYLWAGLSALVLAVVSTGWAQAWGFALVPAFLFVVSAALLLFLAFRPPIEIRGNELVIGTRPIPWSDIRRLDRTGWISPLLVYLTLADESRLLLIYPGDLDASNSLLRHIRRNAKFALIDGIPYRQFWGEALPPAADRRQLQSPRYLVLREEDEAEVERLFQKLKTVGHLDPKSDEK